MKHTANLFRSDCCFMQPFFFYSAVKLPHLVSSHLQAEAPAMVILSALHFSCVLKEQSQALQSTSIVLQAQPVSARFTVPSFFSTKLLQQVSSAVSAVVPSTRISPLEQYSSLLYIQFLAVQFNNGMLLPPE